VEQVETYGWGRIEWLCNARLVPGSALTVGLVEIAPGAKNARHLHPNCEEVLVVVEGELDHSVGDAVHHLRPGESIHIPAGVPHDARTTSATPARVLVAYSTGERETVVVDEPSA
jgi:quercetin dioxygenase-like cupin family protein